MLARRPRVRTRRAESTPPRRLETFAGRLRQVSWRSTGSGLAACEPAWIDFDAGRLLAGEDMDALNDDLESLVLATASGQSTRTETNGYREIAVWKTGVTV